MIAVSRFLKHPWTRCFVSAPGYGPQRSQEDARRGMHWASGHNADIPRAAYGYEPTRKAAMAAFAKIWWRET